VQFFKLKSRYFLFITSCFGYNFNLLAGIINPNSTIVAINKVKSSSIAELATGVFSILDIERNKSVCSGFRISDELVMTNHHCLSAVHSDINHFAASYAFDNPLVLTKYNQTPDGFSKITFENNANQSENTFQITKIEIAEIDHDFAVLRVPELKKQLKFQYHFNTGIQLLS
jgi:hypothetical protein